MLGHVCSPIFCGNGVSWERGANFDVVAGTAYLLLRGLAAAGAEPIRRETVYDMGPGVTPPRVIKQVNPHYSTDHGVRAVGSVIIALVVSSKGVPKEPHVVKGIDKDLDQSAVEAVKEWRFAPAQKNGKANRRSCQRATFDFTRCD